MQQSRDEIVEMAGEHIGGVIMMMYDGVAFPDSIDSQRYQVVSHEGDELGWLSTSDVEFAICFMKQRGKQVGKCSSFYRGLMNCRHKPGFSFAWEGTHPFV